MYRSLIYLTLFFISVLAACTDHLGPAVTPGSPVARLRVKTLTLDLPNNLTKVSSFSYNAQGQLSSILTYQTPDSTKSEIEYSVYQYNAQNQLTQLRHTAVLYPRGSQPNPVEQYMYTYNGAGQVTTLNYLNGFNMGFTYNGANKLATASRNFTTGGLIINGGDSFTFTGDNLTGYKSSFTIAGHGGPAGPGGSADRTLTYDGKINPFYGVYVIPAPYPNGFVNLTFAPRAVETYFGGVENVLNLSPNNALTDVNTGGPSVTYQYQYNASNLPILRIKTTTFPAPTNTVTVETLHFDYEAY